MKKIIACLLLLAVVAACHHSKKSRSTAHKPKPKPKPAATSQAPKPKPDEATYTVGGVVFQNSDFLQPVLEKAQKEKRPVMVEFHAEWCAPCHMVEEDVFPQRQVYEYLNANFLNFRVDFDASNGKTLASLYEVKGLPTMLFLDPQGVVLERILGAVKHSEIKRTGDLALGRMKK